MIAAAPPYAMPPVDPQAALDYRRVGKALRFLEERRREQPSLEEVAAHVGLSPFHFQRLFQRWAGTSPKRFLQYLTREHARRMLEAQAPVLEVAQATGLSSASRLHSLFVTTEGVTPGELKRGGEAVRIAWGVHPSPFGSCLIATTRRGVCGMAFADEPEEREAALERVRRAFPAAELARDDEETAGMARMAFGDPDRPLPVVLRGSPFQLRVWQALVETPPGSLTTYRHIAERIGHPTAARAVGNAVGANPVAWLIPCHRVIRAMGELGGYRWGRERKRAMLGWEATQLAHYAPAVEGSR